MKPEKVIRDGQVAILVSHGFGAGWSTWAHAEGLEEFCAFDAGLVKLVEEGAHGDAAEAYIKSVFGEDCYIYTGGWGSIEIEWLPEGTRFYIHEYDGSESLRTQDNLAMTA